MWWLFFIVGVLIILSYWSMTRFYKFWVNKGVPQSNPVVIFGDSLDTTLKRQSMVDLVLMLYNMFPNARYSGFYQFLVPTLLIRDPDLIKLITVKDFDHFVDHNQLISAEIEPLWANNLFALSGQKWREMRNTLSPAFTGSKMKFMFSLICKNGEQFVNYFLNKKDALITIEMKDTFTKFTNDIIASTAFGVECDSLQNARNEFYLMGKELTDFSGFWKNVKFISFFILPQLFFKTFNIHFFSDEVSSFFTRLVKTNVASREKHKIVRPDMLHLLLEARKHALKHEENEIQDPGFATVQEPQTNGHNFKKSDISDEDMVSQALIFFSAGFETVSTLMCFMSYELGVNQHIQELLIEEIDTVRTSCKGKLTYEALTSMKYLDMVVSETLRKWPNVVFLDRNCTKPYTIEPKNPGEVPVHLQKDSLIWVPVFGIHRDAKYWPEPDRFDPERFSDENKSKIQPYTYMPFGSGPRNCIGSRFALLECKILFFYLLAQFRIVPVDKTQIPLVISKKHVNMNAEKGFWFGLQRRNSH